MIPSFLLTFQVFSSISMQGSASKQNPDPENCTCWGSYYCLTPENRKYLAKRIVEIMDQNDGKPEYKCYMESFAQDVLLDGTVYKNQYKNDLKKLHAQEKRRRGRQPQPQEITSFLNKTIKEWEGEIREMGHKNYFGCELNPTVNNIRIVCLFD